jgi:hypothetical protein
MSSPDPRHFALLLDAADDLGRVGCAYDAELLTSTLLGSAYAVAEGDRGAALDEFVAGFTKYLARRRGPRAALLRAALAALVRSGRPVARPRFADPPAWLPALGTARPTAAYAYGDEYGDQVSYLAVFDYPDPAAGGPEHVLVALVDHNLGFVKELFITSPAQVVVEQIQAAAAADPDTFVTEIEPGRLRREVEVHLRATDTLSEPPDESLTGDRAIATARLRRLPDDAPPPEKPDVEAMLAEFMASPEAKRLIGARRPRPGSAAGASLLFCAELICGFAQTDPLRWSPAAADLFLLDWVPRRAVLDDADTALLPRVLDGWVRWSGRTRGLSPKAIARTVVAIAGMRADFTARITSGEQREPAAVAVAQALAEGVDLGDEAAVEEWIARYNATDPH